TVTTDPVEKIDSAELPRVDSNEKTQVPAEARKKSVAPGTAASEAPSAEPQSPPATGSRPGRTTNPGQQLRKTNPPTNSPIGRPTPAPARLTPREMAAMRGRSHTPHLGPEVT